MDRFTEDTAARGRWDRGSGVGAGGPVKLRRIEAAPRPAGSARVESPRRLGQLRTARLALVYLLALVAAEVLTTFVDPEWGLVAHLAILGALLVHAAVAREPRARDFFSTLMLCPVIRIVSLGMPLGALPQAWWYALTAVPLLAACAVLLRTLRLPPRLVGLALPGWRAWPLTLLVAASGVGLGWIEFQILPPTLSLAPRLTLTALLIPSLILLVGTGLMEELVFRGLLQTTSAEVFGVWPGILYVSLLFAALHTGHRSALDVLFVLAVALYFAAVVRWTRSLLGVSLAHGVTNIMLFLVLPLLSR